MRTYVLLLAGCLTLLGQDTAKTPITAADLLRIRQVASIAVANDGSFAVYAVRSIFAEPAADAAKANGDTNYGYRTHLWRVALNDPQAKPVQLTFGDRNDQISALSPDGRRLAFLRTDNPSSAPGAPRPKPQVFLLPVDSPGEAVAVTKFEQGAVDVEWRPDGKALLVTSAIPLSKLEGKPHFSIDRPARQYETYTKEELAAARPDGDLASVRAWLYKNALKDNPTLITRMNFEGEQGLAPEMTVPELFLIDLEQDNKSTQLTKNFYPHINARFSPDGKTIVYSSTPDGRTHPDRLRRGAVRTMTASGSDDHAVLDDEAHNFQFVRFSPDGSRLLVLVANPDDLIYQQPRLALAGLDGKLARTFSDSWDATPQGTDFDGGAAVLFTSPWHGGFPLMRMSTSGGEARPLIEAPAGVQIFAAGGGRIVYALTTVANPNELYLRDKDGRTRRLTDLNESWVSQRTIIQPEERWLTRPNGTKVQYWVMNPAGAQPGRKYPWVLDMHGGPAAMWGPGEFSMWYEFQLFCSWGYGVVYSNPRGSGGYGISFQKANHKDWGAGPSGDVLAALDEVARSNPFVDPSRLFLTGGSYAGYLTAWIVGHDHRFKAAAAQRGVYELTTFYGEGNAYRLVEGAFGGFPWNPEAKQVLDRESPFTYVASIRTPLLIIHASQDLRTGVTQSEMLYRALQQQKKPVEYVRYPSEGHELTRSGNPGRRMDHMLRIVEFFERYAGREKPASN